MKKIDWTVVVAACALGSLIALAGSHAAQAAQWSVVVTDNNGKPLSHAAVILTNGDETTPLEGAVIAQRDAEFVPAASIIPVGSKVSFPNFDRAKHHVYSFSKAKSFQLELFKNDPADPLVFDESGIVAMGCNMHDWMYAVTYVVDSPYAALTDEQGKASFTALPTDDFELTVWHPRHPSTEVLKKIAISDSTTQRNLSLNLRPEPPRPQRPKPITRRNREAR